MRIRLLHGVEERFGDVWGQDEELVPMAVGNILGLQPSSDQHARNRRGCWAAPFDQDRHRRPKDFGTLIKASNRIQPSRHLCFDHRERGGRTHRIEMPKQRGPQSVGDDSRGELHPARRVERCELSVDNVAEARIDVAL